MGYYNFHPLGLRRPRRQASQLCVSESLLYFVSVEYANTQRVDMGFAYTQGIPITPEVCPTIAII